MALDPARAKTLFLNAAELADPAERAAYLDRECGDDVELRERVEALLNADKPPDSAIDHPTEPAATIDSAPIPPSVSETVAHTPTPSPSPDAPTRTFDSATLADPGALIAGRYTLQEKIGEGGMGEVWVAKQTEPVKRRVALKLIKTGMDSRAVLQRFEQERQALAMMDHPNIARVLDGGITATGQPFFVMELVNGLSLTRFCDEARLNPRERLELFVPICQAVQHAHQKGIVHRDLKPANILVTMVDGRPVPKVIDFGVAKATSGKLTDESMNTQFGAVLGTLEYMSPEQAGFSNEDIDTRADIYSLGVILYELLTGLRPIDRKRLERAALTEMIRIIREDEPSKPSTRLSTDASLPSLAAVRQTEPHRLTALLRGDLDCVVMKCLEKPRERRYETANALARDVQRYLADEPIEARPPTAGYRLSKLVRRHRGPVLAASLVALALVGGIIGTTYGLVQARAAAAAERIARLDAQKAAEAERLAKTSAEARRVEADKQKARAESREQQAIDAVKRFRDAVADNPELKNNPGLESLRKSLLKEPLAFFQSLREQLQTDNDTRPEALARLAQAVHDYAHLTDEIGDVADGLRAHDECLAIWETLTRADPGKQEYQAGLARIQNCRGGFLHKTGKTDAALAAYTQSLAIQERLVRENPGVTESARQLAGTLYNFGSFQGVTGQPEAALESFARSLAIRERLARENPSKNEFASDLAQSHINIGKLQQAIGRPAAALESFRKSLPIWERLVREYPNVTEFARDLAINRFNIGVIQQTTGQPQAALESYHQAQAIWGRLASENPSVTGFANLLAGSHHRVGSLQYETGRPEAALESYGQAVAIQEKLARENPSVIEYASELARTHASMGQLQRETGHPEAALESFARSLAIRERLARENPSVTDFASRAGGTLNNMAQIDIDAGRFAVARDRLLDAIAWQKKALGAEPRHPRYREFLANHYRNLHDAAQGLGDGELRAEADRALSELTATDPRFEAMDQRLVAISQGEAAQNNPERLALAQRAYDTRRYALAARLWGEALENDPKLGEDRRTMHRYNAACAAAPAAAAPSQPPGGDGGEGTPNIEPPPTDEARAALRHQALAWLQAELGVWTTLLESATPEQRQAIAQTLAHWQTDPDLASLRDHAIDTLPEPEQAPWRELWANTAALLAQARGPDS